MVSRPAPASALPPGAELPEYGGFWRSVLEDVRDPVFVQDPAGAVRWANAAARTLAAEGPPVLDAVTETTGRVDLGDVRRAAHVRALPEGWRVWTVVDDSPRRPEEFLAEAGPKLAAARGRHGTARVIAELAASALGDCVFVLLPTTRGRWEWWSCEDHGAPGHGRIRRVPAQHAPAVAETFVAVGPPEVRVVPAAEVATMPAVVAERFSGHAEVSVVSLGVDEGGVTGAVLIGRRTEPAFGAGQPRAIEAFATAAGTALANAQRYARQEEATRGLETTLKPTPPAEVEGANFELWYEPAGGVLGVGGDFYDVLAREDGSAFVVVGDICGKGAEAAALTGRVRHSLAALQLVERDGRTMLRLLNELLIAGGSNRFATLVLGSVAPTESGLDVTLASGGHPAPLVLRRDGGVEEVSVPGTLVGISPQARFAEATVHLDEGDVCLLYTDGVTEARNRTESAELFGDERFHSVLADCVGLPAHKVVARLREAVRAWLGNSGHDDIAVLAIEAAPRAD
ncbi:PP2C family protein-serine/threonine phosphatase [Amycolatopsis carbonis]|uniref:PP2C family protein-serine/threonine phosphatase n=1 Tax=Amycolatopsis carbonis TaxID=715471 RepID=A0A9Y2IPU8_9PSEU|nr:PP2C family protein-serine/threonine phosphatase [Amycolatopsis sp. 2-15]WIX83221.1 PP2C family protein-serine/threonine phosphatase [Amycolatopsis sp. 2-15]